MVLFLLLLYAIHQLVILGVNIMEGFHCLIERVIIRVVIGEFLDVILHQKHIFENPIKRDLHTILDRNQLFFGINLLHLFLELGLYFFHFRLLLTHKFIEFVLFFVMVFEIFAIDPIARCNRYQLFAYQNRIRIDLFSSILKNGDHHFGQGNHIVKF